MVSETRKAFMEFVGAWSSCLVCLTAIAFAIAFVRAIVQALS